MSRCTTYNINIGTLRFFSLCARLHTLQHDAVVSVTITTYWTVVLKRMESGFKSVWETNTFIRRRQFNILQLRVRYPHGFASFLLFILCVTFLSLLLLCHLLGRFGGGNLGRFHHHLQTFGHIDDRIPLVVDS